MVPNNQPIIGQLPSNTKNMLCCLYLSYLFRLQLLSEDSYLFEGVKSADKKNAPKNSWL